MTILEKRNELKRKIQKTSSVFIMGHKHLDLDALGAAIGMYTYAESKKIPCYIIIDDRKDELSVKKMREKIHEKYHTIRSNEIKQFRTKNDLLIIVDTNKKELTQNPGLIDKFHNIIIIDHHEITENTIKNSCLIVDTNASSTCEMVAQLLEQSKIDFAPIVSTILLSGIVLDTNNFVLKTTSTTFRMAYFLSMNGAEPKEVQYILKQDLKQYIERQKVITDAVIIKQIAISYGKYKTRYRREDLAKIADTLLLFNKIEASFVVGRIDKNTVGISARSLGNIDIGTLLEIFNGGGNKYEAAAQISNTTTKKVKEEITDIIRKLQ